MISILLSRSYIIIEALVVTFLTLVVLFNHDWFHVRLAYDFEDWSLMLTQLRILSKAPRCSAVFRHVIDRFGVLELLLAQVVPFQELSVHCLELVSLFIVAQLVVMSI